MEKTFKRSIHGRKLQSQQRIFDQPTSSLPSTPINNYLTTDCISPRSTSSINCGERHIKQVDEENDDNDTRIRSRSSLHLC